MFQKYMGDGQASTCTEDEKTASQFDDPVAALTAWSPLAGGGSNFTTHKLHQVSPDRYELKVSVGMKLFTLLFIIVGLVVALVGAWKAIQLGGISPKKDTLFLILFGAAFALVGSLFGYSAAIPTIIDREKGYFLKGWKSPERSENPAKLKNYTPLNGIHALQLIAETLSSKNGTYQSYELNLVLTDGSRLNVTDHGGLEAIRDDAQQLAAFLGKPLWDAI